MYIVLVNIRLEALREHKPLPNPLSNSDHDQKLYHLVLFVHTYVLQIETDRQPNKPHFFGSGNND